MLIKSILIPFLTIILIVNNVNSAVIMSGTIITSNGVRVFTDNHGNVHCDLLVCPKNTACVYQSANDPNNSGRIITARQCVDESNNVVDQSVTEKIAAPGEFVNVFVTTKTDPELAKKISKHVEHEIKKSMDELNEVFTDEFPFQDGNPFGEGFPFKGCNPFGPGFPFVNPCEDDEKK